MSCHVGVGMSCHVGSMSCGEVCRDMHRAVNYVVS